MAGRNYKDYRKLLQSLLPSGRFWTRNEDSTFTELLNGLGSEMARVEDRSIDLIYESLPSQISETFEEWEEDFEIPDDGEDLGATDADRRAEIKAKFIARGNQHNDYFIEIAEELGYTVTITEYDKSLPGIMVVGQDPITPENAVFYWFVDIDVSADMTQYYTLVNISQLIKDITKRKPAQTIVLFRFTGVEFDRNFSNDFDCIPWYDGSSWPISFSRDFSSDFANAYDYDGVNLTGSFNRAFSIAFDRCSGGDFNFDEFGDAFSKPS